MRLPTSASGTFLTVVVESAAASCPKRKLTSVRFRASR